MVTRSGSVQESPDDTAVALQIALQLKKISYVVAI